MVELSLEAIVLGVGVGLLTGNVLAAGVAALVTAFIGLTAYHAGYGAAPWRKRGVRRADRAALVGNDGGTIGDIRSGVAAGQRSARRRSASLAQAISEPPQRLIGVLPATAGVVLEGRPLGQRHPQVVEPPQPADLPAQRQRGFRGDP